jgi:hypothetical protein
MRFHNEYKIRVPDRIAVQTADRRARWSAINSIEFRLPGELAKGLPLISRGGMPLASWQYLLARSARLTRRHCMSGPMI